MDRPSEAAEGFMTNDDTDERYRPGTGVDFGVNRWWSLDHAHVFYRQAVAHEHTHEICPSCSGYEHVLQQFMSTAGLREHLGGWLFQKHLAPAALGPTHGKTGESQALTQAALPIQNVLNRLSSLDRKAVEISARVHDLEHECAQLRAMLGDEDKLIVDPDAVWIEKNRDLLRSYPDSYVAIDTNLGVVAHAKTQEVFAVELDKLSLEERQALLVIHTSMYF